MWFLRPGGSTGWHVHPGRALVTVKTGQLTLHRAKGCRARTFSAGQTFLELGPGDVNLTRNQTAAVTEAVVTFLLPVGRPDHGGCARPQLPAVASTEITRSG
jgi:quercetin dioxygenase-like cupin family protein